MKKPRWRFILLTSWLVFIAAFLLGDFLLRVNSVEDRNLLPWALTHTPSQWALMLVLGTLLYGVFIFGPFQLPFIVVWSRQKTPPPRSRNLVLLMPCMLVSAWLVADTLKQPHDSRTHFESQLKRPLPAGATHCMALHPLGTGTFSELWGSVHGYRMRIPLKEATAFCQSMGGALYDFPVDSLAEPYDAFLAELPTSWGYVLGQTQLQCHQIPPICGKPAFALIDPQREEMLILVWQQKF